MIDQIKSKYPSINIILSILKKLLNKKVKIRKFKTFHKKNIKNRKINDETIKFIKLEGEKINDTNNFFSNNSHYNKCDFFNLIIIENNIINNNIIESQRIFYNSIVNNIENIFLKNILLNYYLIYIFVNDSLIKYLFQINNLFFYQTKMILFIK